MKKLTLFMALLMALVLSFSGCGKKDKSGTNGNDSPPASDSDDKKDEDKKDDSKDSVSSDKRLVSDFMDLMKSETYTVKYIPVKINEDGSFVEESPVTLAVTPEAKAIIGASEEDGAGRVISKDKKIYIISDKDKMVTVLNEAASSDQAPALNPSEADYDKQVFVGNGKEDFLGENRDYEEYSSEDQTLRYYFDAGKLIGMKSILPEETTLWKIEMFSDDVDDSLFLIPSDYEQFEMGN